MLTHTHTHSSVPWGCVQINTLSEASGPQPLWVWLPVQTANQGRGTTAPPPWCRPLPPPDKHPNVLRQAGSLSKPPTPTQEGQDRGRGRRQVEPGDVAARTLKEPVLASNQDQTQSWREDWDSTLIWYSLWSVQKKKEEKLMIMF